MDVRFVPPDLRRLDALKGEALSLPFFADERPLRGALGLVDWRLCGELSRLLVRGRVSGVEGEKVLVPARPKLPFDKLFLFGLGPRESFDEAVFERAIRTMFDTLSRAKVRSSVWVLPGRPFELIAPVRAMELFIQLAGPPAEDEHDEITLVEDPDAHKTMAPVVDRERRRVRAESSAG